METLVKAAKASSSTSTPCCFDAPPLPVGGARLLLFLLAAAWLDLEAKMSVISTAILRSVRWSMSRRIGMLLSSALS